MSSSSKVDGKYVRISVGRCEACNKILEESEMRTKGYLSNVELGLCRKCSRFVNSPALLINDEADDDLPKNYDDYQFRGFREAPIASLFDSIGE